MSTLILVLLVGSSWPDSVVTLDLSFDTAEWEYACEHCFEDIWLNGVLECEEESFQVSFRIRGQTSREYPKKSIKVELLDGELFGYSELNLNAEFLDRSRMRECLSYEFHRALGLGVPETGLIELRFNGETQGPYLFVQDVDEDFAQTTILPDEAVIYKCRMPGSSLDQTLNFSGYRKKTWQNDPWDDLELLIAWLVNSPDSMYTADLDNRLHLDQLCTLVAANVLIGHGSTYYHNYHTVLDSPGLTGRWRLITWDMDKTWGISYGPDFPYYFSSNGRNHPNTIIWRCWCLPVFRILFLDRITSLSDDFEEFASSGIIDSLELISEPLVEVDPFRDFTMEEFAEEVNMLRVWPSIRISFLTQMQTWPLPFRLIPGQRIGNDLQFSWTDAGPGCLYLLQISTDSIFETPSAMVFEASTMDTFFVLQNWSPPVPPANLYWTVFASNSFKTEKALNWFLPYEPPDRYSQTGQVVINEICYTPSSEYPSGDWVELVNTGSDTLSLEGWSLRDGNNSNLHTIGMQNLPPGDFIVLYADSLLFRTLYPACFTDDDGFDFGLSAQGDAVRLYDLAGRLIDRVDYLPVEPWPLMDSDGATLSLLDPELDNSLPESWTSCSDGGTPGISNDSLYAWTPTIYLSTGHAYPSPCSGSFSVEVTVLEDGESEIGLYDLAGRLVTVLQETILIRGTQVLEIETNILPSGLYFLSVLYRGVRVSVPVTVLENP